MNGAADFGDALVAALRSVGVRAGGLTYVASSLAGLAMYPDPVGLALHALQRANGPEGTLIMPSGNGSFRYAGHFDREQTPSMSGIFSEAFRCTTGVLRTCVPPYNTVCAYGRGAARVAGVESATAFGPGSVFDLLIERDALMVLFGCSFHDGVAHVHWLEERHDVPYRLWQDFTGDLVMAGQVTRRTFPCHVRRPGVRLHAGSLGARLDAAGATDTATVGLTKITAFRLGDFVDVLDRCFASDPEAMVITDRARDYR